MDDIKLLNLIKTDPSNGIKQLMNQYSGLIYSIVKNRISDVCISSDIEDCVEEVFCEFYMGVEKYDYRISSIKSYLCTIANYRATNVYKARKRNLADISLDDENVWIEIKEEKSVEHYILSNEQRKEILKEIKALGEPDSTIIFLKFYIGETSKQISKRLGLTVSNVDTRTHRALKKLKEKLGGEKK